MADALGPLFQRSEQQRERLQALYHLAVEISALQDLKSALNTALWHCLDLTESQFGFIGLNTPDGSAMDVAAIQGFHPSPDFYAHFHLIPLRPSLFARAVLEGCRIGAWSVIGMNAVVLHGAELFGLSVNECPTNK